ncbi:efflux RND transporter periplasmic adaptor subunit [Nodularia harveyana UHCC-0300]|uniref:Efflux RND transporter periplasmic adaptor subunit n=1 Tax=Nodularia harveyana UHCC-0300 TaxID=2974287 RepID=A0ABU5UEF6_9CYAN|nr:efflux RND transporter periplasmic adaptor subunit [Nodularia harveyana]MEA5581376.1 efflux RND transporter periplasmic adaptor subunit [Nodularia harveyana UHCC-0300]
MSNFLGSPAFLVVLSLFLWSSPIVVVAHPGHGDEFKGGSDVTSSVTPIQVDAQTSQRLGIKVEPVKRQQLAVSIKTTGQIETLPSQKALVTTPIAGAKVAELLVEPGTVVKRGQPVAVLSSPELVSLRVESEEKLAGGRAELQQAQADLRLAQQNSDRLQEISAAEIVQAQAQVAFAEEKYNKDRELADAGALPRRNALESQTQLTQAQTQLATAKARRDVIAAQNQVQRAQAAVEVAKSRISLSNNIYETRLQQLGIRGNSQGLVTITAPISGTVTDREVTLGQSFQDAGDKLMMIVNDSQVFATANIYEKDLERVKNGQQILVKIASIPDRTFTGRITVIGSVVEETRIVPVKAEINNPGGLLKPGMFAELEVLTDQTSSDILTIPNSAVVEANGKQQVYIQNGNAYQPVEVTLGQTSGDMVEVKTGVFEGDLIVTQRAPQLYAQSLRSRTSSTTEEHQHTPANPEPATSSIPPWLMLIGGSAIACIAFTTGAFWTHLRQTHLLPVTDPHIDKEIQKFDHQPQINTDKHR